MCVLKWEWTVNLCWGFMPDFVSLQSTLFIWIWTLIGFFLQYFKIRSWIRSRQMLHIGTGDLRSMVKDKLGGQKPRDIAHVWSHKIFNGKNKAKFVTTNFKKTHSMSDESKTDTMITPCEHKKGMSTLLKQYFSWTSVERVIPQHGNEPDNAGEGTEFMACSYRVVRYEASQKMNTLNVLYDMSIH